jgi:rhodanese-related sulfurtransferase
MIYLILASIVILVIVYNRYFPVLGVKYYPLGKLDLSKVKILDIRDYNDSYKNPIEGSLNIPLGYLKRNISEIPHIDLHLVVSSLLEKNVGARVLRQKGYRVVGYSFVNNKLEESHLEVKVHC